jgi:CBS domain-containing protein
LSRLNKLVQIGSFQADDAEFIEAAYQSLMLFRLRENLRNLSLGQTPSNYINPNLLSKRQRSVLRESFLAIERLQTFTSSSFRVDGHL